MEIDLYKVEDLLIVGLRIILCLKSIYGRHQWHIVVQ